MQAGNLRDRVDVQRPVRSAVGGPLSWEAEHQGVPAEVEFLTGTELFEARSVVARASVRVTLRYLEGLDSERRLVPAAGKPLNILAVLPDARRTRMELLCEEARDGL